MQSLQGLLRRVGGAAAHGARAWCRRACSAVARRARAAWNDPRKRNDLMASLFATTTLDLILGILALGLLALVIVCSGCMAYTLRVTEGVATSADINCSQGSASVSFLSGLLIEADEVGRARLWYESAETNSYFGVVHSGVSKRVAADFIRAPADDPEPEKAEAQAEAADAERVAFERVENPGPGLP